MQEKIYAYLYPMLELNEQFSAFLNTKGISAKFKLAFNNMSESARKQHAADVAEFSAFLKAKGLDGKYTVSVTEE